jgi:uncharacterized protein YjbI with pentapeptide repeats
MDSDCQVRSGDDLEQMLERQKRWIEKYNVEQTEEKVLEAEGAFRDPLRLDLSGAQLQHADLAGRDLVYGDLTGAKLDYSNLERTTLDGAELAGAHLASANLFNAEILEADLAGAGVQGANLTEARMFKTDLTSADLNSTVLTRAHLDDSDLTGADLRGADLSGAELSATDLSGADLAGAQLWYADFEPKALPRIASIARADGLETLCWTDVLCELERTSSHPKGGVTYAPLSFPERWLMWLFRYRQRPHGEMSGWQEDLVYFWSDFVHGRLPGEPQADQSKDGLVVYYDRKSVTQGKYALLDLRNALRQAGYAEAELLVNLAYQRHTQSALRMVLYDWTCGYGAAPGRPLVIALVLALLAVPLYWVGFRHRLFGCQLLQVRTLDEKTVELPLADPSTRPKWRSALLSHPPAGVIRPEKLAGRMRVLIGSGRVQLSSLAASCWPRLRWEGNFVKSVFFFSLISMVNLGFEGLDFGRWVRNLFFREYDLKGQGWLRTVSGLQSLIGLGLVALSLLSFFGHPFE